VTITEPGRASSLVDTPERSHTTGWIAGAVLLVGLAVVATVAAVSGVSLVAQHHIHAGAAGFHEVGKMYVPGWTSPEYNPFADHRLRAITPLLTIVYLFSATALGSVLVGAMRGSSQWPAPVRLLAGFLPGYLMLLGPLQLLFAAVPLVPAAWLALVAVATAAIAIHGRSALVATRRLRYDAPGRRRLLGSSAVIAGLLLLAALHRLQMGYNFMVTDSISVFLKAAQDQLSGAFGSHLVQWDQQSDEWIFNAPLMFTSHAGRDFLLPFYITEFVGLTSFGCLAYGIVHSLAPTHRRLSAGLATAVVLLLTPAIFPWFYVPLIGGHNPVVWLGHPGRFIAIAAPWVTLLLLGRHGRGAIVAIGLATVGLGFVTLHATVYVLAVLGAVLCWMAMRARPASANTGRRSRTPVQLLAFAAIGAPILTFCLVHAVSNPSALAWVLVAGVIFAVFATFLVGRGATELPGGGVDVVPRTMAVWSLAWLAALALGIVLSNNLLNGLTGGQLRTLLGEVLPGYRGSMMSRELFGEDLTTGLSFPKFSGAECMETGTCSNAGTFLADWGFFVVVAYATWIALGRSASGVAAQGRRAAWLLMVAAAGAAFLLVDFTGASLSTAWILTRFLEVPFYGLFGLAAITFAGSSSKVTKWAGVGILVAWSTVPIVVNLVPWQLVKNADWLVRAIG
jgi:hypothetical protein